MARDEIWKKYGAILKRGPGDKLPCARQGRVPGVAATENMAPCLLAGHLPACCLGCLF